MSGHVFIIQGDIRMLACDAWLMPCDLSLRPLSNWTNYPSELPRDFDWPPEPPGWGTNGCRVAKLHAWPHEGAQPWLVHVGAGPRQGIGWYVDGARQFLEAARADLEGTTPLFRRQRHLLAIPVVGTRYGGARRHAGSVVRELLPMMVEVASEGVDVVLVTNDGPTFAASQKERGEDRDWWPELDEADKAHARRLSTVAESGELVLFIGAGVSAGAGLPTWGSLLAGLARSAGVSERELAALAKLDFLDQARIISGRLGEGKLGPAVVKSLDTPFHSLTHALLARLPAHEVVTTNYDCLFELASRALGQKVAALPHMPVSGSDRWILKMHGCLTRPDDIVLTREDYIRYAERRAALAGIVQALLITRHMFFIGFSLEDDNFHRIVDAVRKAIHLTDEPTDTDPFGTAITLARNPLLEELWASDLQWVAMSEPENLDDVDIPNTARKLEVFLDYLLAQTDSQSGHILDTRYDATLSDADRALKAALSEFAAKASPLARGSAAWSQVEALFARLGFLSVKPRRGEG